MTPSSVLSSKISIFREGGRNFLAANSIESNVMPKVVAFCQLTSDGTPLGITFAFRIQKVSKSSKYRRDDDDIIGVRATSRGHLPS